MLNAPTSERRAALIVAGYHLAPEVRAVAGAVGRIVRARTAGAFLRSIGDRRVHLVLVDVDATDPTLVAAALEARRNGGRLRIVALASRPADRVACLQRGFDDAFDPRMDELELTARLRLLGAGRTPARNVSTAVAVTGDSELDLVRHELRRGRDVIHLRPMEFRLLATLASHPGRAYSRRELLRVVWGPDSAPRPRTVDVHVRWLRAKLEPDPGRPRHLMTVRAFGYRLDPSP